MKYNSYAHISNFSSVLRLAKIRVSEDPPPTQLQCYLGNGTKGRYILLLGKELKRSSLETDYFFLILFLPSTTTN